MSRRRRTLSSEEPTIQIHSIIRPKSENQRIYIDSIKENVITIAYGPAGSGKTAIATSLACHALAKGEVDKIIVCRPLVEAGRKLGDLPGDLREKLEPYLIPIFDEMSQYFKRDQIEKFFYEKKLELCPLELMRGRNFHNTFVILDECFVAGTKIKTGNKTYKSIEEIQINDLVLSYSTSMQQKRVSNIFVSGIKPTVKLYLHCRKNPIIVTENHPFAILTDNGIEYKPALDLQNEIILRYKKQNTNNNSIVNHKIYDIILGILLGDGCLQKNKQKKNVFRLMKSHSLAQYEYVKHTIGLLLAKERNGLKSGYTGKPLCGLMTNSIVLSKEFIDSLYDENGQKRPSFAISKYMSERSLAYWYMDDGSKGKNSISLHTEGYSLEQCEILSNILLKKFNIESSIYKSKDKYYFIGINKDTNKFFDLVAKYIHPSMDYKLPEEYKNQYIEIEESPYYENLTSAYVEKIENYLALPVYNIEVEDNNNYFANGILVHNCQNATYEQLKMCVTRIGMNSTMILTGDLNQTDLPHDKRGALEQFIYRLKDVPGVGIVKLESTDIVRNPIIAKILTALEL